MTKKTVNNKKEPEKTPEMTISREPVSMKFLTATREWMPTGRHIRKSLDLSTRFKDEVGEDRFADALATQIEDLRLWIHDLTEEDIDGLTVRQLSYLGGLVIVAAMKSQPGLIVNNCSPHTFTQRIGANDYTYTAKFENVRANQKRREDLPYPEEIGDEWDYMVEQIQLWTGPVLESDLDHHSQSDLNNIYQEIYTTAVMWLEPELKKVLEAAAQSMNRASRRNKRKRTTKKNTTSRGSSATSKRKVKRKPTSTA